MTIKFKDKDEVKFPTFANIPTGAVFTGTIGCSKVRLGLKEDARSYSSIYFTSGSKILNHKSYWCDPEEPIHDLQRLDLAIELTPIPLNAR